MGGRLRALIYLAALLVAACGSLRERDHGPPRRVDIASIPDAVPRIEPRSPFGNPGSYVVDGQRYHTLASSRGYDERGIASWYGSKFHGLRTSSGEPYDMYAMTAAHRSLPLPSYVEVTNLENGRRVVVRVNDRGPFHKNRIIDLSYVAAAKLGIVGPGTGLVEVRAIDPTAPAPVRLAPAPRSKPMPRVGMYLQVGAFADRDNALRLKTRLHSVADTGVLISEVLKGRQPFYRVRLGPLNSVEEADRLVDTLAHIGINDSHVVVE